MAAAELHTFLFADLAGFTALTDAMGDEPAVDLAMEFSERVREVAGEHGVECVKTIGDAVMLRCTDAAEAVRAGVRIANEVGGRHYFPTVRVGMHTGPAVERGGDWFGATVNVAARVSGQAGGGEVLLTDATRKAAGAIHDLELREVGRHQLRNVADPMVLLMAVAQGPATDEGLPIDPVCRMAVDPDHAAGAIRHDGREYHFCSLDCVSKFCATPDGFTSD